jgi:hypothetical protein
MPSQIERIQAHASHLLDAFILLRERYAMLHPMLFEQEVAKHFGSYERSRGFRTLRHSLFLSCAQDIAKLTLDNDKRTPSIGNIVGALDDNTLCNSLRTSFSEWVIPSIENETDPEIAAAIRMWEQQEAIDRGQQFDNHLSKAKALWGELSSNSSIKGFVTIRDKVSAHTEVRLVADKYQFVDIGELGIKWSDIKAAIELMQQLVELIGLIVRNAGFAWDMLDEQLDQSAKGFWRVPDASKT